MTGTGKEMPFVGQVELSLRRRLQRAAEHITFECGPNGRLVLRGQLTSFYQKQLAQEAVRQIDGVNELINEIVVGHSKA